MLNKEECLNALETLCTYADGNPRSRGEFVGKMLQEADDTLQELIKEHFELKEQIKNGTLSDGYHTFNELYDHRAILFSIICNQNKAIAWKSKKHDDGTMFDGMFIVGIKTPLGQYTYHYDIKPYWKMFDVKELENAPKWDGHQPKDIDRLFSINDNPPLKFEELKENTWVWDNDYKLYCLIDRIYSFNKFSVNYHFNTMQEFEENRFYKYEVKDDVHK